MLKRRLTSVSSGFTIVELLVVIVIIGIIVIVEPLSVGISFVWLLGLYTLLCRPTLFALSADY